MGAETVLIVQSKGDNWFFFNQDHLAPLNKRNQLIHALHNSADLLSSMVNAMHDALSCLNKHVKDKILIAKAR